MRSSRVKRRSSSVASGASSIASSPASRASRQVSRSKLATRQGIGGCASSRSLASPSTSPRSFSSIMWKGRSPRRSGVRASDLVEHRDRLALEAPAEPGSGVDAVQAAQVEPCDRPRAVRGPVEPRVVEHHELAAAARPHVVLDAVDSQFQGAAQARERVLRRLARRSPVPEDQRRPTGLRARDLQRVEAGVDVTPGRGALEGTAGQGEARVSAGTPRGCHRSSRS